MAVDDIRNLDPKRAYLLDFSRNLVLVASDQLLDPVAIPVIHIAENESGKTIPISRSDEEFENICRLWKENYKKPLPSVKEADRIQRTTDWVLHFPKLSYPMVSGEATQR